MTDNRKTTASSSASAPRHARPQGTQTTTAVRKTTVSASGASAARPVVKKTAATRKAELLSDAYSLLSEIEKEHFSLEKIYISAMDFSRKEEYQEKLIKTIFS